MMESDILSRLMALEANVAMLSAGMRSTSDGVCDYAWLIDQVGGGGGGSTENGCFRIENGNITNCHFQFGRTVHEMQDVSSGNGTWYLKVPTEHPENAVLTTDQMATTDDYTIIPLFKIENGVVVKDWRGMPVIPVRE